MPRNSESPTSSPSTSLEKCPSCKMPFILLASPKLLPDHLAECSDFDRGHLPECFYGKKCDSNIESHFHRYNHNFEDMISYIHSPLKRKSPNKFSPNKCPKVSPDRKKLKSDPSRQKSNDNSGSSIICHSPLPSSKIPNKLSPGKYSKVPPNASSKKKLNFESPTKNPDLHAHSSKKNSTSDFSSEISPMTAIPTITLTSDFETVKIEQANSECSQEDMDSLRLSLEEDFRFDDAEVQVGEVPNLDKPAEPKNVIESNLHVLSGKEKVELAACQPSSSPKCSTKNMDSFLDKDQQTLADSEGESTIRNLSLSSHCEMASEDIKQMKKSSSLISHSNKSSPVSKIKSHNSNLNIHRHGGQPTRSLLKSNHVTSSSPIESPNKTTLQKPITSFFTLLNLSSHSSQKLEATTPKLQKAKKSFVKHKAASTLATPQRKGALFKNKVNHEVIIESEPDNTPNGSKRHCPFYKKIKDTAIAVDAFSYGSIPGIKYYLLSHFHSDHYQGLTKKFPHKVYCSKVTANMVKLKIRLPDDQIKVLPLDEPVVLDGIIITLLDANHCPGSVMFHFELPDGSRYLHTGDFRANQEMEAYLPPTHLDLLYLDTTYCKPTYSFPSQREVLSQVEIWVWEILTVRPNTLFVCGSYLIGKERLFMSIAEALDSKIWANIEKLKILKNQENPFLSNRLVHDAHMAQVHVVSMNQLNRECLQRHLDAFRPRYDHLVAFSPTGWEYKGGKLSSIKPQNFGDILLYGVPYSEHSSFEEMRRFVQFLHPDRIIPTVNVGSVHARNKMENIIRSWLQE